MCPHFCLHSFKPQQRSQITVRRDASWCLVPAWLCVRAHWCVSVAGWAADLSAWCSGWAWRSLSPPGRADGGTHSTQWHTHTHNPTGVFPVCCVCVCASKHVFIQVLSLSEMPPLMLCAFSICYLSRDYIESAVDDLCARRHNSYLHLCTPRGTHTHTHISRNWQPDTHSLVWKRGERRMWKDEVIVQRSPPLSISSPSGAAQSCLSILPSAFPFSFPIRRSLVCAAKLYEGHQAGPASRVQSDSGERSDGSAR